MKACDFSKAKKGDKVYDIIIGTGVVIEIQLNSAYPLVAEFEQGIYRFLLDGRTYRDALIPTLYWKKFDIEIPDEALQKPLPDYPVDTKMIVWSNKDPFDKHRRYFSHFDDQNRCNCFVDGSTSWSGQCSDHWDNYQVVEEEQ